MSPPVKPTGSEVSPPDPRVPSETPDRLVPAPVVVPPDPAGVARSAEALSRLVGEAPPVRVGALDPARVAAARAAMGVELPIISPPAGDWTQDIGFNVWIRRNGLIERGADAALMAKVHGVFRLLASKDVQPFMIPTDRQTTFSTRSIEQK